MEHIVHCMQICKQSHSNSIHRCIITITCEAKKTFGLAIFLQCPVLIVRYMVAEPAESMLGLESFEFRLPKTRYQRKLERLGLTSSQRIELWIKVYALR